MVVVDLVGFAPMSSVTDLTEPCETLSLELKIVSNFLSLAEQTPTRRE